MTEPILVPKDLIAGLSMPQHERLLVTAWVLSWPRMSTRETFYEARSLWPGNRLRSPGRLSVLSILLELEALGVCHVTDENGAYIHASRGRKVGAA